MQSPSCGPESGKVVEIQLRDCCLAEIAENLGISASAVKARLFHARAALRHSRSCASWFRRFGQPSVIISSLVPPYVCQVASGRTMRWEARKAKRRLAKPLFDGSIPSRASQFQLKRDLREVRCSDLSSCVFSVKGVVRAYSGRRARQGDICRT